jgi:hypothetical protein
MDPFEARDHLNMVDGILRNADRTLHFPPLVLVAWGLFGAAVNASHQARSSGMAFPPDWTWHLPSLVLLGILSVWTSRRGYENRQTLIDQSSAFVFLVVFAVLFAVSVAAHDIIPARASALFWSAGFSTALLIVGLQASRPLLIGGIALLAACVAACLIPGWFDGLLALGWAIGFAGSGILLALLRRNGRTVSI